MNGVNKAFIKIDKAALIERVINILKPVFKDMVIVSKDAAAFKGLGPRVIEDLLDAQSPLSGIHAGLSRLSADHAFCVGCDTPFLKKEVVDILLAAVEPDADVIVPDSGVYYQPLCAVYSKRCVPIIEAQLNNGDMKVDHLFEKMNVKTVSYDTFKTVDPELISFFNINAPADLDWAEKYIEGLSG